MNLSEKLVQLRKRQNWTQANAAKIIDIQQSYLSKLENGHHLPSHDVIGKLCKAYDIQERELLLGETRVFKRELIASILIIISILLILTGYFSIFFPQTYYTYKISSIPKESQMLPIPNIHLTDQYLGEQYIKIIANNDYTYKLVAQREIYRIENRRLIAAGIAILLLTVFFLIYKVLSSRTRGDNIP